MLLGTKSRFWTFLTLLTIILTSYTLTPLERIWSYTAVLAVCGKHVSPYVVGSNALKSLEQPSSVRMREKEHSITQKKRGGGKAKEGDN